ncbi:TolC family protein [Parvularcula sp. ZS-1/3]|uniref:TolC family protein n=1 Tax=Parvularcula mediterranea TaxID=2732508 RepID=A0A7Y3RP12_9PROT|nr:TolC family protein [Parvularcula mediterranea]NNU17066.1 TolC family protein [Parvularcula mediterranea]
MSVSYIGGAALAAFALGAALPAAAQTSCAPLERTAPQEIGRYPAYTLDMVMGLVKNVSPEVRAMAFEAVARSHEARQAGLWSNPVLSFEVEDFGGGRFEGGSPLAGFDAAETTLSIGQTFRLGNKRRLERLAALARTELAEADRDVVLRLLQQDAAQLFFELAASEQAARLASEAAVLSQQLTGAVAARVEAGKSPRTALDRARAATAEALAQARAAEAETERLRFTLSSLWGGMEPVRIAGDDLMGAIDLPAPATLAERIETHPEHRRAEAGRDATLAERRAARAQAFPDVTTTLGVRRFEADASEALVAGISLPLPLFDRSQGRVRAASARNKGAAYEADIVRARLVAAAARASSTARILDQRRAVLVEDALPAARAAAEAARIGYEAGKFDLTTALDAQSAFLAAQRSAVSSALATRIAETELKALAALPPFSTSYCAEDRR